MAEKRERRAREAAKRLAEELKDEARIAPQAVAKLHASSSGCAPAADYCLRSHTGHTPASCQSL